jgi:hypothetical protein
LAALAGCDKTETVTRAVNLHDVPTCAIAPGTFGQYTGTGDYEPAVFPNQSMLIATDDPQPIDGVPSNVQSLALKVEEAPVWQGVTRVAPSGDVDMLVLPSDTACSLVGSAGFEAGMVLAAASPRTLIAMGATIKQVHPSFRVDLETGRVNAMTHGIAKAPTNAATAALGDGRAMVIGGLVDGVAQSDIAIYDDAIGDFEATTFPLQTARAHHGAAMLANGDVLVAGGTGANGLVAATERIFFDGSQWRTSEASTPALAISRNDPFVLQLAGGNILVAGGTNASLPVDTLELFAPDGTSLPSVKFHAQPLEAYVALEGGGALYVGAPGASDPPDFQRAWFITSSGSALAVTPDVTSTLTDVKLFPRAGGGALLWTGSTWVAFDPWAGMLPLDDPPSGGPDVISPIASADPGSRAWVAPDGSVMLWRDDVRNAFATDDAYLTLASGLKNLAPDFFSPQTFDDARGLDLDSGATVYVADARYLDFTVAVDSIGATDSPPLVVLRTPGSEIAVGGGSCPYPPVAGPSHVYVARRGASVFYSLGGIDTPCATIAPSARVSVGIRGGGAGSHVLNFSVARADAALH